MRRNTSRAIAWLVSAGLALTGCATTGPLRPEPTSLQIRSMQTRDFETKDKAMLIKAAMNLLQDEGFIVRDGDAAIGFLTARRDVDLRKPPASTSLTGTQVALGIGLLAAIGTGIYLVAKNARKQPAEDDQKARSFENPQTPAEPQDRMRTTECTVTLTPFGEATRVRVNFEEQVTNDANQVTQAGPIRDAAVYQAFFEKLDKSLFLERETVISSTPSVH
jgi:hypothetical protein